MSASESLRFFLFVFLVLFLNFVCDLSCRSMVVSVSRLSVKKTLSVNRRVGQLSVGELSYIRVE